MLKKIALPSLLLALATVATADECCPPQPNPCCPPPDPCAACAQLWPTRGPNWIVTPNAGPCVSCGADAFVTGEFLYWTAREDHLSYAQTTGTVTSGSAPTTTKGKAFHPEWKFRPGFRVGVGMLFDHDGWDIYANYTWQRFNDIKSHASPEGTTILVDDVWFINGGAGTSSNFFSSASSKWHLEFNVVDLELGRNFFVSRHLQLRPHFGLKGTWQEQKMDVFFNGVSSTTSNSVTTVFPFDSASYNKNEYWGIGIRTGLDAAWHFTKSFSMIGEAAISGLWEGFEVSRQDFVHNQSRDTYTSSENLNDNFHTIKPVVELYLGLRWETWFCCDSYHMSVEAGWEEQFWGDQNQFFQIVTETRLGDLSLQGLTVKARFDF